MNFNTTPQPSYQSRFLEKESAQDYADREYGADSYATFVWKRQAILVKKLLQEIAGSDPASHHLDFACGTGRITRLTEGVFSEVSALDISPAMVELARAICPRTRFYVGNILDNRELCPGPFTSITAFRLLLNLDPSLRPLILKGLYQRLKPGGTLLINIHGNRHSLRQPAILWKRWRQRRGLEPNALMLNDMSVREARQGLEAAGFSVEHVRGTGVLPPMIYRWPMRGFWSQIDEWLSGLPFLNPFCIDLIFVCLKKELSSP